MLNEWTSKGMVNSAKQGTHVNGRPYSIVCTGTNCYMYFINIDCDLFKPSRVKANYDNIQRYTPITVDQTAPFQTRKI